MYRILKVLILFNILLLVAVSVQGTSDPDDGPSSQYNDDHHDEPGEPLSTSEFLEAEKILLHQSIPDNNSIDPIEMAGLFEGDIVLDSDYGNFNGEKNGATNSKSKWPKGVLPFTISSRYNNDERLMIARAMTEIERRTCIQFQPRRSDTDYISITPGEGGCSSDVGRIGGTQDVTLGKGCMYVGIIMHELNHAIGFWHEQNRHDRDDFITVHFENIKKGAENNFRKIPQSDADSLAAKYDTSSLMHYGPYAFTKSRSNGRRTITPKESNDRMGQRENLTEADIFKINKLYGCNSKSRDSTPIPALGTTTTSTTTNKPSFENSSENCEDRHKNCQSWADSGECEKNPNWMLVNCKKSCNQCRESCADNNKNCEYWAANGECKKNPDYMHVHCKKSCKKC